VRERVEGLKQATKINEWLHRQFSARGTNTPGNLFEAIDKAQTMGIISRQAATAAHGIRKLSNFARHEFNTAYQGR
jgi:hypothetical protein